MRQKVLLDGCVNCKACEMACSLHHVSRFSYQYSSIAVELMDGGVGISFRDPFTCDTCEGEGSFQCVKYCYRAKDALKAFIESQGASKVR